MNKIACFNGSRFFGCEVFQPGSRTDDPDALLFFVPYLDKLPLPRNRTNIWGILHNESPTTKVLFMYEETLNLFNFSATVSRYSDVPLPLMPLRGLEYVTSARYFVSTSMKNYMLTEFAPVMYLQSNCDTSTERDAYVEELMKYIQIDSYGYCLNNKELSWIKRGTSYDIYDDKLMNFIAKYKFVVAIENGVCNDYISEKLWRAIEVGVVPIYYGSPLIRDWLPNNKSAILLEDYPTPKLLSQHLHYLLQNDTAYEEYLEHKTKKLISNEKLIEELTARPYQTDFEAATNKFECFICEKLHTKDSNSVNIVTKKHYNCPLPSSALTLAVNPANDWLQRLDEAKAVIDELYEDIRKAYVNTVDQKRFAINLQIGPETDPRDDIALHVNFNFAEMHVIRNSLEGGEWGMCESYGGMPLEQGAPFDITIVCEIECFRVECNGYHFCDFVHRVPGLIGYIAIDGDVVIHMFGVDNLDHPASGATTDPAGYPVCPNIERQSSAAAARGPPRSV
ncbi:alpha-(1,3)-fucosyltransferase 10-like [Pectinophora gossypiella]|uniref:alpha-(1,3)-fucosyltransferase 10-like n=1 Tax=Pectinophora gossypiella TaxID=13191 RepID=UPI00214E6AA3|nr:alpha-(1,3)-fucosyltransferase 10-like [Pectinophora gossypiella]